MTSQELRNKMEARVEELSKMNVKELRAVCKENGVKNYAKFNKATYIQKNLEAEGLTEEAIAVLEAEEAKAKEVKETKPVEAVKLTGMEIKSTTAVTETKPTAAGTAQADYSKVVNEYDEDGKAIKEEIFEGEGWSYKRVTANNFFRSAEVKVNGEKVKVKSPSKKAVAEALNTLLGLSLKIK